MANDPVNLLDPNGLDDISIGFQESKSDSNAGFEEKKKNKKSRWVITCAAFYNALVSSGPWDTITIEYSDQEEWKRLNEWLQTLEDNSIDRVLIFAHGNSRGFGPFSLYVLNNIEKYPHRRRFLELLRAKLKSDGGKIIIRACYTGKNEEFMIKLGQLTDAEVIAFTGKYAVIPFGKTMCAKKNSDGEWTCTEQE